MILLVIDTQKGITDERLFKFAQFKENVSTLIKKQNSTSGKTGVLFLCYHVTDRKGTQSANLYFFSRNMFCFRIASSSAARSASSGSYFIGLMPNCLTAAAR